jgi:hypothetical protein
MRDYLRPFAMSSTRYRAYVVCSVYLDSADFRLYRQTVKGECNRFKLRIRTYSDDPSSSAYFEVKKKVNKTVLKRRAELTRAQAREILNAGRPDWRHKPLHAGNGEIEYFVHLAAELHARPIMRVKYRREAYEATGNEPVRITIDTDLEHSVSLDDDLGQTRGRWNPTPTGGAIVEIKFTDRFPSWVQDFVRIFGLNQQSVPKYILSLDCLMRTGRAAELERAGLSLPAGA